MTCLAQDKLGLRFLVYNQTTASLRLLTSTSCVGSFYRLEWFNVPQDNLLLLPSWKFPELGLIRSKIILEVGWCTRGIFIHTWAGSQTACYTTFMQGLFSAILWGPSCPCLVCSGWDQYFFVLFFSLPCAQIKKLLPWLSAWLGW